MTNKKGFAGRYKGILMILLAFGPAFLLIFISSRGCEHKFKVLDDFGNVPIFTFTDYKGKKFNNDSFKDKVVLYTTIQTTCPDSCAISLWHLDQMIYQHLRKNQKKLKHVRIVSFLTDGEGNESQDVSTISAILKDQVEKYDENLWIIAKGNAKNIFDITRNGEKLTKQGDEYFGGEAFQELLLLVDKKNHLRMVLNGKSEGMIRRMKEHMALLDKQYDKEAKAKNEK
jgi:cytochrome oxidase Cu insertion factor (SCO1/SenC/PrrC family)